MCRKRAPNAGSFRSPGRRPVGRWDGGTVGRTLGGDRCWACWAGWEDAAPKLAGWHRPASVSSAHAAHAFGASFPCRSNCAHVLEVTPPRRPSVRRPPGRTRPSVEGPGGRWLDPLGIVLVVSLPLIRCSAAGIDTESRRARRYSSRQPTRLLTLIQYERQNTRCTASFIQERKRESGPAGARFWGFVLLQLPLLPASAAEIAVGISSAGAAGDSGAPTALTIAAAATCRMHRLAAPSLAFWGVIDERDVTAFGHSQFCKCQSDTAVPEAVSPFTLPGVISPTCWG